MAILVSGASRAADDSENKISIINVSGGLGFPYFQQIKAGAQAAAKDLEVDYQFVTGPNTVSTESDFVQVIRQSIARKPSIIILDDFFPDAMDPLAKQAVADGITVLMQGDGRSSVAKTGAMGYVGADPEMIGKLMGDGAVKAGVKHGLCVIQTAGNPVLEGYCAGFAKGVEQNGGKSDTLTIPNQDANNDANITRDIQAYLVNHPEVDGLYNTSSTAAIDGLKAIKAAGLDGKVQSFVSDNSAQVLQAIVDGKIALALDNQPYLLGYSSVVAAVMHARYGFDQAAPQITGPVEITKANVEAILESIKKYPGVRGAL
ncbi:substrate-binding domain-containing protein [Kaistia dalseonensis]|uniref:Simple sugar transport system substrate-binding protein n=1 Tax=Kaistia dalseonensis TaxID=410840 RepID=A0ABU0H9Y0_9HYPH|nr:substrate-binding domain-containing protein [Kaistia dalseonensis]MCX5496506.1 substrate-binding domain-containing protein [Kaistia dalseonensis]MDQ0439128.1 simple sugar transport system substrate-binding protein [Kaistia dalseonensis]